MPSAKRRSDEMDSAATTSISRKRQHIGRSDATADASNEVIILDATPKARTAELPPPESAELKLNKVLTGDLESLRQHLTCKICEKFFYEPYVLQCGHTYCYRCLATWFKSSRLPSCPNCRVKIKEEPAPCYSIKDMVSVFASRQELLPEGETLQEHETWQREEAELVTKAKAGKSAGGLFDGYFADDFGRAEPYNDPIDDVMRCPHCHWELEDDYCHNCGVTFDPIDLEGSSGYGDSWMDGEESVDADLVDIDQETPWYDGDMTPLPGSPPTIGRRSRPSHSHRRQHGHVFQTPGRPARWLPDIIEDMAAPTLSDSEDDEEDPTSTESDGSLDGFIEDDTQDSSSQSSVRSGHGSSGQHRDEGTRHGRLYRRNAFVPGVNSDGRGTSRHDPMAISSDDETITTNPRATGRLPAAAQQLMSHNSSHDFAQSSRQRSHRWPWDEVGTDDSESDSDDNDEEDEEESDSETSDSESEDDSGSDSSGSGTETPYASHRLGQSESESDSDESDADTSAESTMNHPPASLMSAHAVDEDDEDDEPPRPRGRTRNRRRIV